MVRPQTTENPSDTNAEKLDKALADAQETLPSQLKWLLSFNKENWIENRVRFSLESKMRGLIAEKTSEALDLANTATVFSSIESGRLTSLHAKSFVEATDQKTKEAVLAEAVRKSLIDKPTTKLNSLIENQFGNRAEEVTAHTQDQIVSGYSAKGRKDAGIFFDNERTSIPDGLVVTETGEKVGGVEVKAYTPAEMEALLQAMRSEREKIAEEEHHTVHPTRAKLTKQIDDKVSIEMTLGVNLVKEQEFVDILRGLDAGLPSLEEETVFVVRFPNDIPDKLLTEYGEELVAFGYKNVVIQKLPAGTEELLDMAKNMLKAKMTDISSEDYKGMKFDKKREIPLLKKIVGM